jgi:Pyridoxamine 5'-phosphate oxidase
VGKVYDGIDERLERWIAAQPLYFVGTAPLDRDGHVNVSPKAPIDTLKVLGPHAVAYLDFVGSGAETIAHLRENGRVVIMLCAFHGPPRIVRLHGHGEILTPGSTAFDTLAARAGFPEPPTPEATRSIVTVKLERVSDSCGYGVPLMSVEGTRPHFDAWAAKQVRTHGPDALREYQRQKNSLSIDGLPAVELPDMSAPVT